jgi:D-xylose 1-dehydrogenase (NADP+, D-xylono-1,5-lactone-forming)
MPAPVRWGVLSTALINRKVLAGAALSSQVQVLAVASRDLGRATSFAAEHGIARPYGSYEALLADPDVEAVYIPLPNSLHHPWTLAALRAGKHVLCEKPYSRKPDEVVEGFDLAEASGLVLSEAFMYRYHPQIRRAAELVRSGAIGELRLVNASFSWPTPLDGDIRTDAGLDGGSLMDVGCYCVSAARLFAGEPRTVAAQRVTGPSGVDTSLVATMGFDGGVLAHLDCAFHVPDRSHLEIVGSTGTIRVSDPWHCLSPGLVRTGLDGVPHDEPVQVANSYRLELEQLSRAVRARTGIDPTPDRPLLLLGRDDALGQARAIEAMYSSADRGGAVRL